MKPLEIYFIVQRNLTEYFNELTSPVSSEESVKVKFDKLMKAFDLLLPMSMSMSLGSDLLDLVFGIDKAVDDMDEAAILESWVAINELIADHLVYGLDSAMNDRRRAAILESWVAINSLIAGHLGLNNETVH